MNSHLNTRGVKTYAAVNLRRNLPCLSVNPLDVRSTDAQWTFHFFEVAPRLARPASSATPSARTPLREPKAGKTQRSELFENRTNCEADSAAARQLSVVAEEFSLHFLLHSTISRRILHFRLNQLQQLRSTLDARRSQATYRLGRDEDGIHRASRPPKLCRCEFTTKPAMSLRESTGRPFNGRPVAFSFFRGGAAFGEAVVFYVCRRSFGRL